MPPADAGPTGPARAHGEADELNDVKDDEVTYPTRRAAPRHGAAAPACIASNGATPSVEAALSGEAAPPVEAAELDDDTLIVRRDTNEHPRVAAGIAARILGDDTRPVARRQLGNRPGLHASRHSDSEPARSDPSDEATVRSSRGNKADDTRVSSRRAPTTGTHAPVVDPLQRRYEPPQVQSGASVRYAARATPAVLEPKAPALLPAPAPDPARIRLADAAASIRERAAVTARRRGFTLIVILATSVPVLLAAVLLLGSAILSR